MKDNQKRKPDVPQHTSIKKNFTYQLLYEILVIILPLVTSPYIARVIGVEGLGIYSYSYSVAYYFVLFANLGIKNYGNRAIAQVRENREKLDETFSDIAFVHIAFSLICTVAYVVYVLTLKSDRIYAAYQILYVIGAVFDISWFYFGIEKFKLTVTRNTIIRLAIVLSVFIFVKNKDDLGLYCLIMGLGHFFSQIVLWIPLRRYINFKLPKWNRMKVHIKPLFVLFIPAIAISLYKYMDKIMIGALNSKTQLGFYENAEKIINIPLTIITSFGTVMLPKMSNLFTKADKKEINKYISISMQMVMCLAFALAFGIAGVAKVFAPVFWGEDFKPSGNIIMGLAITIPFLAFANIIRTQYLIPNTKDKEYIFSVVEGALINLIINWLLIPKYGAYGATIGTIAAEVTVCLSQTFSVRKNLPIKKYFVNFCVFIPIGAVMFALVYFIGTILENSILTLVIQIASGFILYALFSLIYFLVTRNAIILNLINSIKKKFFKQHN